MARPISAGKRDMILNGNLTRAILTLAIPVMINSFIQSMYNLTDTFWLGKIGTANQAAITLVSPFQNILINFGAGITTAGAILISQYLGAKEDKQANSMANHICITSLGFSVVCAFICWLVSPGLVKWLGAEGEIYRYGLTYIRIVVLDLPFLFMINLFTSVKQAQGDTVRPLLLNILGVSINLILDPLFLVIFNWGIGGAALATLLAKIPSAIIGVLVLRGNNQLVRINFKNFKFDKNKVLAILKIGLPTAIGGSTMQFGFLLMTKNVNAYGPTATTAYGIGNKINSIITMPASGIGSAISTIVGQNMGAGNIKRTDKSYHIALRIGAVFLFICGMILSRRFIAEPMVRFFTSDEHVVPLATQFLSIMAICCWTNAFYNVTQGLFQGCGHTMITMAVDATRIWIFRFLTLWVCANVLGMGVESVWYAVVVSNATSAQGDTVRPLLLNILGVSINLILDPLFLVIFNWGIGGAALATLLAKIPSAIIGVLVLRGNNQLVRINFKNFKFDKNKVLAILKIGLPTAIGGSTMQFGFLLMTKNVNAYGPTATTAYGIGNKINSIITMPASGIGSAISTIVGQNMGAGNIKRTDKSYHIALRIGAVFLFICGMILSRRFIAEPMVRFFTSDEHVVPLATQFLSIMAICCWTNAFYNVTQGLFQGCGHTMITMAVDATRIWIFRFLTLWVCANVLGMGVESVWYAVVVSNATSALILYILYWTGIWKKSTIKIEKTQDEGNNSDEKVKSLNEADSDIKVSSNIQTVN